VKWQRKESGRIEEERSCSGESSKEVQADGCLENDSTHGPNGLVENPIKGNPTKKTFREQMRDYHELLGQNPASLFM
jgi:hypothetical protein